MWLRYGECLSASGQLTEAVEAFSKVVDLAPNHLGARVSLSALQQQIGRHDEALQVLSGGAVVLLGFFLFYSFFFCFFGFIEDEFLKKLFSFFSAGGFCRVYLSSVSVHTAFQIHPFLFRDGTRMKIGADQTP